MLLNLLLQGLFSFFHAQIPHLSSKSRDSIFSLGRRICGTIPFCKARKLSQHEQHRKRSKPMQFAFLCHWFEIQRVRQQSMRHFQILKVVMKAFGIDWVAQSTNQYILSPGYGMFADGRNYLLGKQSIVTLFPFLLGAQGHLENESQASRLSTLGGCRFKALFLYLVQKLRQKTRRSYGFDNLWL